MDARAPERRQIVVDGSNIATEGRTSPSLAQLNEAILAFLDEHPEFSTAEIIVVVDASFGHRIDPEEVPAFDQAIDHGEIVTPPAGALGRGDGFILRIAEKSGALVLSNDSFQEFHAERPWLFEPGRLIGGKPVPGVGWVFTPRTPVRGPRSRAVTSQAKREAKAAEQGTGSPRAAAGGRSGAGRGPKAAATAAARPTRAAEPGPTGVRKVLTAIKKIAGTKAEKAEPATPSPASRSSKATKRSTSTAKASETTKATRSKATGTKSATKATKATKPATGSGAGSSRGSSRSAKPATATPAAAGSADAGGGGRSRGGARSHEPLNDAQTFFDFVGAHPVGSTFEGTVSAYTSHGAHIDVDGMLCHVPLRNLGDPAPLKARQVLAKGETRTFSLISVDAPRRRAEVALVG